MMHRVRPVLAAACIVAASAFGCGRADTAQWTAAWTAAPQRVEPHNLPPAPGLTGNTLRQNLRVTLGGEALRLHFSNAFGDGPLTIDAASVALAAGDGAIIAGTARNLTFGGSESVVIAPGATATSDDVTWSVAPLTDLTISIHVSDVPEAITGHPGSRTTSWIATGNRVTETAFDDDAVTVERWYILSGIDVLAAGARGVVVALGNSITDGRGSGTDRNTRWPDELAYRLQADPRTDRVAVINAGIGGNAVLAGGLGPTALSRLDRDVLDQPGARWLIVLAGINDIGTASPENVAGVGERLIEAYREIVARARARGIRVYGGTLPPFGGSFYDQPEREAARQAVNEWIRTSGEWDGVIDFDAALRDPSQPTRLLPDADSGDHLHPGEAGYRMMAEAIDLSLFMT